MKRRLTETCSKYRLLNNGDRVVVALSGGADSVALLHSLNSLKKEYSLTLYACHLNHNIRGEEARRDEQFVRDFCEKTGVELFVKSVDIVKLAKEKKQSLELCGRIERYHFFAELSKMLNAKVATAHTASDNVETVLYNISRGTALSGLTGIHKKRDYIIRPLILCTRDDIERYCIENKLEFVTDSTNLTDDYTRNNIRHNVVPVLKGINPDITQAVSRMCDTLTDVKAYMEKIALQEIKGCETKFGYSCEKLLALDKAVLSHSLCIIAKNYGADISSRHIELIIEAMKSCGSVDLSDFKRAVCKQGLLRIVDYSSLDTKASECRLLESGSVKYISKKEIKNINKKLLNNCISCDIITEGTVIRNRKEGDRFTFVDRNVTKSLKKLFNELKIPAEMRSEIRVIANGNTVLWIEGIGVSRQGKVNESSKGAYLITGVEL